MIQEINESTWIAQKAGVVVTFGEVVDIQPSTGKEKILTAGKDKATIWSWGDKNTIPQDREQLIADNGILGELIKTKRDFTLGNGIVAYRKEWVDGKSKKVYVPVPEEVQAFWDAIDVNSFLLKQAKNLLTHAQMFTEYIRAEKSNKILSMRAMECRHIRAGVQDAAGDIPEWYWSGHWHKLNDPAARIKKVPNYRAAEKQKKFITRLGDDLVFDDYYYSPTWWGKQVIMMTKVANIVPEFHLNNVQNGYAIRFWIEIPKDYFFDSTAKAQTPEARDSALKNATEKKRKFKETMDEFLKGPENAGGTMFSEYEINKALGKDFPGIKIHTIDYDIKGDELLKLYDAAMKTVIAAQGIHPTLANVDTAGKLSSGSEMRNAHAVYQKTKTPTPRALLLSLFDLPKMENNWPKDVFYEFEDVEIVTLDESKTGTQTPTVAQ